MKKYLRFYCGQIYSSLKWDSVEYAEKYLSKGWKIIKGGDIKTERALCYLYGKESINSGDNLLKIKFSDLNEWIQTNWFHFGDEKSTDCPGLTEENVAYYCKENKFISRRIFGNA